MNGILVVDKPAGFTSFDVVAKLRGICKTKKIGHGGTLDPMATGVLPVFIGSAAKAVDLVPRQDKVYEAGVLFGKRTDTGDVTGTVLEEAPAGVAAERLAVALPAFLGPQRQTPPMYSAVKVDGKPLYKYAREGREIERKAREVTIHSLELLGQDGPDRFTLRVHCSKGTYVRTLLEDIGAALGVPATMAALRRTAAGPFTLGEAHTLDEIQAAKDEGRLESGLLLSAERPFIDELPAVYVDEAAAKRLLNGAPVYRVAGAPGRCRIRAGAPDGEGWRFMGLGQLDEEHTLRVEKLFVEG